MTTPAVRGIAAFLYTVIFVSTAFALEVGESVVLDPVTGNYSITYADVRDDGSTTLSHATFFPATKIDPTIISN